MFWVHFVFLMLILGALLAMWWFQRRWLPELNRAALEVAKLRFEVAQLSEHLTGIPSNISGPNQAPAYDSSPKQAAGSDSSERQTLPRAEREAIEGTLTGEMLEDRFQLIRRIGEGSMSYVYEARDSSTGDTVAVKVLSPELRGNDHNVERLRREATFAMGLNHPNVCPIVWVGERDDGLVYLIMPLLKGEPLSSLEEREGALELSVGLRILDQVCEGLHHAHEMSIVHRDLKPENVMLVANGEKDWRAVIMDFGLAKQRKPDPSLKELTAHGTIMGTPEFMSPEQIRGEELDGRSDIYALGIMAFEMFTAELPFAGDTAQEQMIARIKGKVRAPSDVSPGFPPAIEEVLMKAMSSHRRHRYKTTLEFRDALMRAIEL